MVQLMKQWVIQKPSNKILILIVLTMSLLIQYCTGEMMSQQLLNNQQHNNINVKSAIQNCQQHYPRLFYTQQANKMLIKFNTISPCNKSYVTIVQNNSIAKYYCYSTLLRIQQNQPFIRYIQNCHVKLNLNYDTFNYSVYGQSANMSWKKRILNQYRMKFMYSSLYRVYIPQSKQSLNFIVLADWGPMKVRKYQPIYPSLKRQIKQNDKKIHGMIIIGDVAYNLDTDNCLQYELFMKQLSQVSPYLPIIPIFGNHQTFSENNFKIFKQTFQSYNLSTNARVQAYQFFNLKIITFDPYYQIYNRSTQQKYTKLRQSLLYQLNEQQIQKKFTIMITHYPIICSQNVFHCQQTLISLPELYKQISSLHKIDLYLGAHMHQYQRIAPYIDGNFKERQQSSNNNLYGKGNMVSIVEGVAGCDVGIIDEEYPVQKFSISHTYNKTGYGILSVSNLQALPFAVYTHYTVISQNVTTPFDTVTINIGLQNIE